MATLSANLKQVYLAYGETGYSTMDDWGEVAVYNFDIIEDALTERSAITVTTADVILTDAQHQSLYLDLSGTLTGNRSIIVKADQKGFWFVNNDTSGAYTITVEPSGGTGVTVTQGGAAIVYSTGTEVRMVVSQIDESVFVSLVGAQEVTNKDFEADTTRFFDATNDTKKFKFLGDLITAGQTRNLKAPDASGTLALTTSTEHTDPTLIDAIFQGGIQQTVVTANTGTSYNIDFDAASVYNLTLTGNCVFTASTVVAGKIGFIVLNQDGTGSRTVTFPAAFAFPSNTAPTISPTASKSDLIAVLGVGTKWVAWLPGQLYTL